MMGSSLDQFDAPDLKTAVRRLYAAERAPEGLTRRVESILRSDQAAAPITRMRINPAMFMQWAAAAVIVVGLSGLILRANYERAHPVGDKTLLAMVNTHDGCCREGNPHQRRDIPQNNFVLMGQSLAAKIKEPVLVAADLEGGWDFVGAALCPVNGHLSAHLVYRRNGQWLSIFSLPASSCEKVRLGGFGGEKINDHMIAGFAQTGGVYCIVGSCPKKDLQLDEIEQLLKKHQGDLIQPRPQTTVAMAELLRNR
jgi:hypothetical protein